MATESVGRTDVSQATPLTRVTSVTPAENCTTAPEAGLASVRKISGVAGVSTAIGGGAGLLAHFAATSKNTAAVIAVTVIIVSAMIISALPKILAQRPAILSKKILRKEANTRAEIAKAGMEPGKAAAAVNILRQLAITPPLPEDQRLSDETYRELLKSPPSEDGDHSPKDEGHPPEEGGDGVVVPFQ